MLLNGVSGGEQLLKELLIESQIWPVRRHGICGRGKAVQASDYCSASRSDPKLRKFRLFGADSRMRISNPEPIHESDLRKGE